MPTTKNLKEMHANLWDLFDLLFQSNSTYIAIFMYKHMRKT